MPKTRQAAKRLRQSQKRAIINRRTRSRLKTLEKKVRGAVDEGDAAKAAAELRIISSAFDSAARKGTTPKNTAARKKARLAKLVNSIGKA